MRILGRDIEVARIPVLVWSLGRAAVRAVAKFERPWLVLRCYLRRRRPGDLLRLRDGTVLKLSSYFGDIVTVFVVFCKEEYGTDFAGKTILDIGANIGTFAVLAAQHGCRRLVAVEPSLEAYQVLCQNLETNRYEDRCTALHAAVCGSERGLVPFATASSAMNSLTDPAQGQATTEVTTTTLGRLLDEHFGEGLDLLKLDCEGAEIEIVAEASDEDLRRIRAIRMEFHGPDPGPTRGRLESLGFKVNLYERLGPVTHTLWLSQA